MLSAITALADAGLKHGSRGLNISIPAPLNPARKPLPLLARDLEAELPVGARKTGSIGAKASFDNSLALLLTIIYLIEQ